MSGHDNVQTLRDGLHARVEAFVRPTFRHDGDPTPHPDEAALVDLLTDEVVLPYELKLRATVEQMKRLKAKQAPCCGGPHAGWIHSSECTGIDEDDAKPVPTASDAAEREQLREHVELTLWRANRTPEEVAWMAELAEGAVELIAAQAAAAPQQPAPNGDTGGEDIDA